MILRNKNEIIYIESDQHQSRRFCNLFIGMMIGEGKEL